MAMSSPWQIMHEMGRESKIAPLRPDTTRRVWGFARPYKGRIAGFIFVLVITSILGLLPPLIFGRILDVTIATRDRGELDMLALILLASAFAVAALGLLERWWSSQIGEGLI